MIKFVNAPMLFSAPQVIGLGLHEQDLLDRLVEVWKAKYPRNTLKKSYIDMKNTVENLGISLPDYLADSLQIVTSWPEKAVFELANLCRWEGVSSPDSPDDPFELSNLFRRNRFDVELPQAIASSMEQSVAFISTTHGDIPSGEPDVILMAHSAQWSTGLWDRRTRSLKAGLTIDETDDLGRPIRLTLFTPFEAIICATAGSRWFVDRVAVHGLRRTPLEPLPFKPTLDRPMGRSRINRAVMTISDRAVRAALRMDVSSEIYTAPGLLLRGIDKEAFDDIARSWDWKLGSVKGVTRDKEDEIPEVTTLPQQTMQPYIEQIRELAAEFSGATNIPISQLGIVQDNPSSSEAMLTARMSLIEDAENANLVYGYSLSRVYQNLVMLRDGLSEPSDELLRLDTKWGDAKRMSPTSKADAVVKQVSAIPELAETDVVLESLGYSGEQVRRIRAQIQRSRGGSLLDRALARQQAELDVEAGESELEES